MAEVNKIQLNLPASSFSANIPWTVPEIAWNSLGSCGDSTFPEKNVSEVYFKITKEDLVIVGDSYIFDPKGKQLEGKIWQITGSHSQGLLISEPSEKPLVFITNKDTGGRRAVPVSQELYDCWKTNPQFNKSTDNAQKETIDAFFQAAINAVTK